MTLGERRTKRRRGFGGLRRFVVWRLMPVGLALLTIGIAVVWGASFWRCLGAVVRREGVAIGNGEEANWRLDVDCSAGVVFLEIDRSVVPARSKLLLGESRSRWNWGTSAQLSEALRSIQPWYQKLRMAGGWMVKGYGGRVHLPEAIGDRDYGVTLRLPLLAVAGFFAVCTGAWLGVLWWLRMRRLAHQVCTNCGYDLAGLHGDAPCPECGEHWASEAANESMNGLSHRCGRVTGWVRRKVVRCRESE
jgi:hypothetical protein